MRGSWQRETALTNNIANADTPGYQRQEVNFESALQGAMNGGEPPSQVEFQTETAAAGTGPNGGCVSVDQESAKLAENGLDYQALTQVLEHPQQHHARRRSGSELMGLFDAIGIAGSGPHRRAHPHGRDRREPRQRRHHQGARTASPTSARRWCSQQVGWPAASAARSRARCSGTSGRSRAASRSTGIVSDTTPDQQVYDPGNPEANAQGYVKMPNVSTVTEMTDLISESAVLPVRRDRDADRRSRCSPRRSGCSNDRPADRRPGGELSARPARRLRPGPPRLRSRSDGRSGRRGSSGGEGGSASFGGELTERDLLAREDPGRAATAPRRRWPPGRPRTPRARW